MMLTSLKLVGRYQGVQSPTEDPSFHEANRKIKNMY